MFYFDMLPALKRLTKVQKADLFEALLEYAQHGVLPEFDDVGVSVAWDFIQPRIDRDAQAYELKCLKNQYELCEIAGKLDDYYNAEVAKAAATIREAKKAFQAATAARTQHQRETNEVAAEIRRAASHDIIGYNHLRQLGAYLDDFKLQTCPGVGYDGQIIVKGAKRLISAKIEDAERLRIRAGATAQNMPFASAEYIPGEGATIFSPKGGRSSLKDFAASLFK